MSPNNEILQLIGAIVLSTQASERHLKLILPFTDSKDPSITGMLARAEKLKRRTFGELVGRFVDASTSDSEHFEAGLAKLVDDRNRVVHHLGETFGKQLHVGDAAGVVEALRTMRTNARAFELAVASLALHVLETLRDTTFRSAPEFHDLDAVCDEFRRNIGQIDAACME